MNDNIKNKIKEKATESPKSTNVEEIVEKKKELYRRCFFDLTKKGKNIDEETLFLAFEEYKNWVIEHPFVIGTTRSGTTCNAIVERPFGLSTFCAYIGISAQRWIGLKTSDLSQVCELIEIEIRGENVDGALVKKYDPLTVCKIYSLADNTLSGGERALNVNIAVDNEYIDEVIGVNPNLIEEEYDNGMENE